MATAAPRRAGWRGTPRFTLAYDLFGASKVGLPTLWHDCINIEPQLNMPEPLAHCRSLHPVLDVVSGGGPKLR